MFFEDMSEATDEIPGASVGGAWDFRLADLASRPNVIVTPHQAFLTAEALGNIAATTVENLREFERGMTEGRTNNIGGFADSCATYVHRRARRGVRAYEDPRSASTRRRSSALARAANRSR